MPKFKAQNGFIQLIVGLVILLLLLSAFKINLMGYLDSTPEQALNSNFVLVIQTGKIMWSDYILPPIRTVWSTYVVPFVTAQWLGGLKTKLHDQQTLPPG